MWPDRLAQFAKAEWGPVLTDVWRRLRAKGPRALPLTLASLVGIVGLQLLQHDRGLHVWVERLGGVYATLPWWTALLRTPVSLFVPDPSLPIWGLLLQVTVVFGIAETTVGARRTLAVALLATLAGTWFARLSLWTGLDTTLGLMTRDLHVRDTGPSAAVVALGVYTACCYRAWFSVAVICTAMVVEVLWVTNLAGYEHLAGVLSALAFAWVESVVRRRRRGRQKGG